MSLTKTFSSIFLAPTTIVVFAFSFIMLIVFVLLGGGIGVPLWLPVNLFLLVLMLGIVFFLYWDNHQKYNPEGSAFIAARKSDTPLLMVEAHNGFGRFLQGTKEKNGDIFFAFDRSSNEGVRIDPSVQSGAVPRSVFQKGLQMFHYGTGAPFPMSSKQAMAFDNILKYVRKNYPDLKVFDGATILEYVSRNRNELPHDCRNLAEITDLDIKVPQYLLDKLERELDSTLFLQIEKNVRAEAAEKQIEDEVTITEAVKEARKQAYEAKKKDFVINYRTDYLTSTFMKIQDETASLPLPSNKLFSYAEAFMNTASAFTAFDYQTLMQLFEMIARKENEMELKWLVGIAVGVGIFIILAALGYQMIGSAKH